MEMGYYGEEGHAADARGDRGRDREGLDALGLQLRLRGEAGTSAPTGYEGGALAGGWGGWLRTPRATG